MSMAVFWITTTVLIVVGAIVLVSLKHQNIERKAKELLAGRVPVCPRCSGDQVVPVTVRDNGKSQSASLVPFHWGWTKKTFGNGIKLPSLAFLCLDCGLAWTVIGPADLLKARPADGQLAKTDEL